MVQLPTGNKRLGENRNKVQSFIPFWIQTDFDKWTIYGGIGYRINPGAGNKNSIFIGAASLYEISPKLQVGGEVFHESPNSLGGLDTVGFNLGGVYSLVKDNNILFSVGKGLKNGSLTNQLSAYLALQVLVN
ncbi:MAG: hypothetical protein H7Z18_12765 [Methylophilaceae bacterium]|nr:hypothetical protein [Methylophilaceae bacterium]